MMAIKLLVADDSATIQKVVNLAFSDEDVIIETVSSGHAAIDSAPIFRPDIVLADVCMPGCSGYEVCSHIKQDPELKGTPVILLVGAFESFDEEEAVRVKCDGRLTKPLDASELVQMVHSLAGQRSIARNDESCVELAHSAQNFKGSIVKAVESRVMNSFLGSDRILDLFDAQTAALAAATRLDKTALAESDPMPVTKDAPSEDFINLIVDRVVRQMSRDVIREVAWEVVPELSEDILRRFIEEHQEN
jgi:CheY-like chemotaxis protein